MSEMVAIALGVFAGMVSYKTFTTLMSMWWKELVR
jgi:hypothetical protein